MTVKLSPAAAAALGVVPAPVPTRRRRVAAGPYPTRCVACGLEFTTRAAEDRHVGPGHNRYELVL